LALKGLRAVFPMHLGAGLVADCPEADQGVFPMHLGAALVADCLVADQVVFPMHLGVGLVTDCLAADQVVYPMEAAVLDRKERYPKQWVAELMACYLVALGAEGIHPLWFSLVLPWLDADSVALAEELGNQHEVEF
jgi:hypothetical protein